jgi:hypothetical protein
MCADTFWTPAARQEFTRACAEVAGECPTSADIVAFAEKTIDVLRRPQIERHLAFCRHCAEEVIALEATIQDEANLAHGFVHHVLSMFDRWLPHGLVSPALAALNADSRAAEGEDVAVGDLEMSLSPHPDGHLVGAVQRADEPVAGAVVRLVYLREPGQGEAMAGAEAPVAGDDWQVVRSVERTTSESGLVDFGVVDELKPRPGEQRVEVRLELPQA